MYHFLTSARTLAGPWFLRTRLHGGRGPGSATACASGRRTWESIPAISTTTAGNSSPSAGQPPLTPGFQSGPALIGTRPRTSHCSGSMQLSAFTTDESLRLMFRGALHIEVDAPGAFSINHFPFGPLTFRFPVLWH